MWSRFLYLGLFIMPGYDSNQLTTLSLFYFERGKHITLNTDDVSSVRCCKITRKYICFQPKQSEIPTPGQRSPADV